MSVSAVLDAFCRLRVLVLGEAMLDSYLVGESHRLCQEAPVPVVALRERWDHPGGAANTAANLAALGCQVSLLSVVGDDAEGGQVRALLAQRGVDADLVTQPGRRTLAKHRVMAGERLLVRFDQGDTGAVDAAAERRLLDALTDRFGGVDAVVVSDYRYGVLTRSVVARLGALQAHAPRLIAVDARDLPAYRAVGVTAVKPNYEEALRLAGECTPRLAASRAETALAIGDTVLARTGARIAAITLDVDGAVVVERGATAYRTYAEPADQRRAAGAGDTYIGALTLALAAGAPTPLAAEIAAAAAAAVVAREGTAACTLDDLHAVSWPAEPDGQDRTARRPGIGPAARQEPAAPLPLSAAQERRRLADGPAGRRAGSRLRVGG